MEGDDIMSEERYHAIAYMCKDLLESQEPYIWKNKVNEHERDIAIDLLLRSVLGLTEKQNSKEHLNYVEQNFYGAYYQLTKKFVTP